MKNLKLLIPDMQSRHCMHNVRRAIESVPGASVNTIAPGEAVITADAEKATINDVLAAIRNAGYHPTAEATNDQLMHYKTTIHCQGCLAKVKRELDETPLKDKWSVDLLHPDKVLTVHGDAAEQQVATDAVRKAGFQVAQL